MQKLKYERVHNTNPEPRERFYGWTDVTEYLDWGLETLVRIFENPKAFEIYLDQIIPFDKLNRQR